MQDQPTSDGVDGTAKELRSDAEQLGSSAVNRIHSEVDARKDTAVDQAKSVSSTISRVAGEMGQDTPDWLKSALQQGAQKVRTFADSIQQKDSRELMRDAQDFARNSPGTFLAACAAIGFAAARVLKAGAEPQGSAQPSGQQPSQPNSSSDSLGTSPTPSAPRAPGQFA